MTAAQLNALKVLGLVYLLFTWGGALLAFRRNRLRSDDDPSRQKYSPLYILIAPVIIPLLIPVVISLLTVFSLLFGAFLVIFALVMLIFRQVALLKKMIEMWVIIGDALLKVARIILRPFYFILKAIFAPEQTP